MSQLRNDGALREGLSNEGQRQGKAQSRRKGSGEKGGAKGGGVNGRSKGQMKGWGYQGTCGRCGRIGQKVGECRFGVTGVDEEQEIEGCAEEEEDVGGVWIVGNIEEWDVEDEGTGRQGCPSKYWAQ